MESSNNVQLSLNWQQVGQAIGSVSKQLTSLGSKAVKLQQVINTNPLLATIKNIALIQVLQATNGGVIPSIVLAAELPVILESLPILADRMIALIVASKEFADKLLQNSLGNADESVPAIELIRRERMQRTIENIRANTIHTNTIEARQIIFYMLKCCTSKNIKSPPRTL